MTVSTSTRRQQFTLDGSTADFTFTFRALTSAPSDIKCKKTASGVDTDLTYTTQFTVAVNSNGVGGTVTLVSPSAIGSGTLTVYRETTNTQESDYDDYNQFPADTLETDLDIRTLVAQEQDETFDRALVLPISYAGTATTTLPTPVSNTILGWNTAANAIENKTLTATTGTLEMASQSDAEAGTENSKYMSALRTFQAIAAKLLVLSAQVNFSKGADIASATTTDIGAATGNFVDVTGTTTITGLGTVQAGTWRLVRFTGALTLTHNATSLILPGTANITTAANDRALFVSLGSGNWICTHYQKASGSAVVSALSSKVIYITRDLSSASGSVATTGIGFAPRAILAFCYSPAGSGYGLSIGMCDQSSDVNTISQADDTGIGLDSDAFLIELGNAARSAAQKAVVASLDSDGFTLTWTKVGSPTGTADLNFLCLR